MNGHETGGWLIPDLLGAGDRRRSLVLVDAAVDHVPAAFQRQFLDFSDRLRRISPSKFTAAKLAVSAIHAGTWSPDDNYRVGVHKMGPVPALKITSQPIHAFQLPGRELQVVAFPRGQRSSSFSDGSTAGALFDCLTGLNVADVLNVYIEDVFEHLKDISDRLNLPQSVARIKAIRETIGQSILSKLEVLTPSPETWKLYRSQKLSGQDYEARVCEWFEFNHATIGEYLDLACLADRCAEMYFELMSVELPQRALDLRGVNYSLDNCRSRFCSIYGFEDDVFETGLLSAVDEVLAVRKSVTDLLNIEPRGTIIRNLRDFLLFAALVRNEGGRVFNGRRYVTGDAVIFVSRRHASTYGDLATEIINGEATRLSAGDTRVTTFFGDGGEPLRPSLKAQMWLADSVWSLLPESDQPVGNDMTWIYLEAEHALVSGKPSVAICRHRQDLDEGIRRMALIDADMLSDNTIAHRDGVRRATLTRFEANVAIQAKDAEILKARMGAPMSRILRDAGRQRRQTLLKSILRLFEYDDLQIFRAAFDHYQQFSFSRQALEKRVLEKRAASLIFRNASSFTNAFRNAHDRSKRYPISVNKKAFSVLQIVDGSSGATTQYQLGLVGLARALASATNTAEEVVLKDVEEALK